MYMYINNIIKTIINDLDWMFSSWQEKQPLSELTDGRTEVASSFNLVKNNLFYTFQTLEKKTSGSATLFLKSTYVCLSNLHKVITDWMKQQWIIKAPNQSVD